MYRDGVTQRVVERHGQLVLVIALHGQEPKALLLKETERGYLDEEGTLHPKSIKQ